MVDGGRSSSHLVTREIIILLPNSEMFAITTRSPKETVVTISSRTQSKLQSRVDYRLHRSEITRYIIHRDDRQSRCPAWVSSLVRCGMAINNRAIQHSFISTSGAIRVYLLSSYTALGSQNATEYSTRDAIPRVYSCCRKL